MVERIREVPKEVYVEIPVPKTPETSSTETTSNPFSRSASLNSNQEFVSRYLTGKSLSK